MITCNRCGASNEENARFCIRCRHKLQSSRRASSAQGAEPQTMEALERLSARRIWGGVRKYLEGLGLSLLLVADVVYGVTSGDWTLVYILAGVIALLAVARGL